ncbi:hypothetical protein A6A04_11445 [Paramagnetospirillum marisnigri]|uniref:Uncharacterized protein n=1 Tax=Paramagnetospirillum marisnigri TaxID=1285242 RepID=A0A178MWZ5_9PROT|nr:hypothetical protein [Paramagnetospirillum marisnigri]OAN55266.1 hypothetical protein A6A04_11445 [Paramagnetospirillum marisnigri]
MVKFGPIEGPCGWEQRASALDLEELHQVLNCAAERGCALCVRCSERALEKLLVIARRERTFGFLALERLEAEMEVAGTLGL